MSDAITPRRPGRPKGPGKRRPESEPAGASAQGGVADTSAAPSNGDADHGVESGGSHNQGQGRPGRGPKPGRPNRGPESDSDFVPKKEAALQVPTKPVEVPPETKEEEAAAA